MAALRHATGAAALISLALALLLAPACAYPGLWENEALPESLGAKPLDATTCLNHPTKPYAKHGAPSKDPAITFAVTDEDDKVVTAVCPGGRYLVTVKFPEPRRVFLTAEAGQFSRAKPTCPGAVYSTKADNAETTFNDTLLVVPCNTTKPISLKVTSAAGKTAAFKTGSSQLTIAPAAKCAKIVCDEAALAANETEPAANATKTSPKPDGDADEAVAGPGAKNATKAGAKGNGTEPEGPAGKEPKAAAAGAAKDNATAGARSAEAKPTTDKKSGAAGSVPALLLAAGACFVTLAAVAL